MSLEKLREWVGRTQAVEDFAAPFPVRALIATFDEKDPDPRTAIPCRRSGTGSISSRPRRSPRSAPTAMPSAATSCRRCRCRAACGPAAASPSTASRSGSARRSAAPPRSSRSSPRPARPGRWCSSPWSTPSQAPAASPSSRSTTSSIARRPSPAKQPKPPRPAPTDATWSQDDHGRPGAAVPLLRAHLQRPSHPLRPALCHRHRRLSRPDRARPPDGHGANRVGAPRQPR